MLLRSISSLAMAGFDASPAGGTEIGGILLGRKTGDRVQILACQPAACEHEYGPAFLLSERDEAALGELLVEEGASMIPVGWYCTEYRDLWVRPENAVMHRRYFPNPWQIAMVFARTKAQPVRIGVFSAGPHGSTPFILQHQLTIGHGSANGNRMR